MKDRRKLFLLLLLLVQALLPLCHGLAWLAKMEFILTSERGYLIVTTVLTVGLTCLVMWDKTEFSSWMGLALLPVGLVNCVLVAIGFGLPGCLCAPILCICCWIVGCHSMPKGLWKVIGLIMSGFLTVLLVLLLPLAALFGDFGYVEVVEEATSPEGTYTAQLINADQGALGGDTFVWIYDNSRTVDLLFARFAPEREVFYRGEWGEFADMDLVWTDDETLTIEKTPVP